PGPESIGSGAAAPSPPGTPAGRSADRATEPLPADTMASISPDLRSFCVPSMPMPSAIFCSSGINFPSRTLRSVVVSMRLCLSLQLGLELTPVGLELLQAEVRERVLHELREDVVGHRRDVGAGERGVHDVHRMTQRGG